MIWPAIGRLLRSDSLHAAIWFAVGGVGFALGNIWLARILSPEDFGVVSLAFALNQFGINFGPFGMEVVANRHRPLVDGRLLIVSMSSSAITALIVALIAGLYYSLSWLIVAMLFVMVIGSSLNRVCVSLFQGEGILRAAMSLSQVHNYILLVAAALIAMMTMRSDWLVVAIATVGYVATTIVGWWAAARTVNNDRRPINLVVALREGLATLGLLGGMQVLIQFERLAIPKLGSIEMLGTYAALAAIAGSPFRMIQTSTTFTLLPRLRAVATRSEARAVLIRELAVLAVMTTGSSIVVAVVSQPLFDTLLKGKYRINTGLIVATIVVGIAKIFAGFTTTIVSACGSSRLLGAVSVLTIASIGVSIAGATIGARYGLLGILYGVGAAWGVVCLGAGGMAVISLRSRFRVIEFG